MEMEADKENSQSQTGVPVILGPVDDEHKKNLLSHTLGMRKRKYWGQFQILL